MRVNTPTWSYGTSRLFNSYGRGADPDDAWSYGKTELLHKMVIEGFVKQFRSRGQAYYLKARNETYTFTAKAA